MSEASEKITLFSGQDVVCRRGGRLVFSGVSFVLKNGDALLLAGRNGAGKSSLLRMMAGLSPCAAGQIRWNGRSVDSDYDTHTGRLRYLGHYDAVKPTLTITENIAFWVRQWAESGQNHADLVDAALSRLGLSSYKNHSGGMISAGLRRRVALARLIAVPAPLWLLDEPAASLDHSSVETLYDLISRHRSKGGMVVLSTHGDFTLPQAAVLSLDTLSLGENRC